MGSRVRFEDNTDSEEENEEEEEVGQVEQRNERSSAATRESELGLGASTDSFDDWAVLHQPLPFYTRLSNFLARLLQSTFCSIFYLLMIVLNIGLIIWIITSEEWYPTHWLFISLEVLINVTLLGEVTAKAIVQGKSFFRSYANLFDMFVTIVCVASLFFYLQGPSKTEEIEDVLSVFLVGLRNSLQFLRLLILIKNQQQKFTNMSSSNRIDLATAMEDEEEARPSSTSQRMVDVELDLLTSSDEEDYDKKNEGGSRSRGR
ncbi:hypothetical protein QOT17_009351 [Balamuthia mandrillaris]